MEHPLSRVHLSNTHWPPRLQTALQPGFKQQDSQHVAPPLPITRGCHPSVSTLLQCIPSTPPVTLQRFPDTPAQVEGFRVNGTVGEFARLQVCSVTHKTHPFAGAKRQKKTDNDAVYRRAVSHASKEEVRLFLAERDTDEDTAQHGQRHVGDRRLCLVNRPTSGVLGSRRALLYCTVILSVSR